MGLPEQVRAAFSWWLRELRGMVPQALLRLSESRKVYVRVADSQVVLQAGPEADSAELMRAALGEQLPQKLTQPESVLVLHSTSLLRKSVSFPLVVEENLAQTLRYQMDKLTPFGMEDVYFDYRIKGRDRQNGKLSVEVVVVPRASLDELLVNLGKSGLRLSAAVVIEADGQTQFNLLPAEMQKAARPLYPTVNRLLGFSALLLLAVLAIAPLQQLDEQIEALAPQINAARKEAAAVREFQKQLTLFDDAETFLRERVGSRISVTRVTAELTRLFPDEAWVSRLSLASGAVQIQGEAPNAGELLKLVEASDLFEGARFSSPVIEDAASGRERFNLTANLKQVTP